MKLHGFTVSNYYNMVKMALLEKGMAFDEVLARPSQDAAYLLHSPMGKVPCLETEHGFITETAVILEYLEDLGQGPALYPEDPFERARVREIMHYLEIYIELPARQLYGDAFFSSPATDETKARVRKTLERGLLALAQLTDDSPYMCGDKLTYADVFYYFTMTVFSRMAKISLAWDAYNEVPGLRKRIELLAQRESVQRVHADQKANA